MGILAKQAFKIFDHCPNIKPQEENTIDVMITTLRKGGCSLGTQRVTTKQVERETSKCRKTRQEAGTLHFY